jgi:hypothetical protein
MSVEKGGRNALEIICSFQWIGNIRYDLIGLRAGRRPIIGWCENCLK